jgi:hypothetical protein
MQVNKNNYKYLRHEAYRDENNKFRPRDCPNTASSQQETHSNNGLDHSPQKSANDHTLYRLTSSVSKHSMDLTNYTLAKDLAYQKRLMLEMRKAGRCQPFQSKLFSNAQLSDNFGISMWIMLANIIQK